MKLKTPRKPTKTQINQDRLKEEYKNCTDYDLLFDFHFIMNFLNKYPKYKNDSHKNKQDYELFAKFINARNTKPRKTNTKIADIIIVNKYMSRHNISEAEARQRIEYAKEVRVLEMDGGEDVEAFLYERFGKAPNKQIIWCSGCLVKHVDFITICPLTGEDLKLIQVKSSNITENRAGKDIRSGEFSDIEKWSRPHWSKLIDVWNLNISEEETGKLNEDFIEFSKNRQ